MDYALSELCRFFAAAKRHAEPLVLATILRTEGSTYRKAGTRTLISPDGKTSGLLSGGCLEGDLRARASRVLANRRPERVWFDTREGEDPVWGLQLGCEGAMDVFLQPCAPEHDYPVASYLAECLATETAGSVATVVGGEAADEELGRSVAAGATAGDALGQALAREAGDQPQLRRIQIEGRELEIFVAPVGLPPAILLCGAGADAIPVHGFATALGWRVTVYDHRPAYAAREHFPQAVRVLLGRPEELAARVETTRFAAAIVMSHHLPSDVAYLRVLAQAPPAYVGLLGPARRRRRVLADADGAGERLGARLHGPAGLDIGASTPQTIALAIVAQIQAELAGRSGGVMAPR